LPRRDFYEPELKELMRVVAEEWSKTMTKEESIKKYRSKKLISHVKIMRDEQKTDADTNDALPSGQAFVEFTNEDLAMFAVRYLNNMEMVPQKGLIVDFSMEDQRALFKRKEKIDRWRQIAKDRKREEHVDEEETQFRKANTTEGKHQHQDGPLDLGAVSAQKANQEADTDQTPSKPKKKQPRDIKSINDIATLEEILKESLSRGQKQRIKKKLARLQDKGEALPSEPLDLGNPNPLKREHQKTESAVPKATAKEKIDYLLKRREAKIVRKDTPAKQHPEDIKIRNQLKNKRRTVRKHEAKEEDQFDRLLDKYQNRVLKKIKLETGESGTTHEEVEVGSD
jgi:hypothetical protein